MKIKKITIQFKFEILDSHEPTVGIKTTLNIKLDGDRDIIFVDNRCRFCSEYIWGGDLISESEQRTIKNLIKTDKIDVINDFKCDFLMNKINGTESRSYEVCDHELIDD